MLPVAVIPQLSAPAIPASGLTLLAVLAVVGMVGLVGRLAATRTRPSTSFSWLPRRAASVVRAAA